MSYELERNAKRAAERLRGLASAWQAGDRSEMSATEQVASDERRAKLLEEIALSLEEPLRDIEQARAYEERRKAVGT